VLNADLQILPGRKAAMEYFQKAVFIAIAFLLFFLSGTFGKNNLPMRVGEVDISRRCCRIDSGRSAGKQGLYFVPDAFTPTL
jgi:hypothetical protein